MKTELAQTKHAAVVAASGSTSGTAIETSLRAIRQHLRMDVAFIAEFEGDDWVLRHKDGEGGGAPLQLGMRLKKTDTYCYHLKTGKLPLVIGDTAAEPVAQQLEVTRKLGISSYIGAPIMLSNGECYGMFCCYGSRPDVTLNPRDENMMRAFAQVAAFQIDAEREAQREAAEARERVRSVIDGERISMVLQPIWNLRAGTVFALEALCRVAAEPQRGPDVWLQEAGTVGLRDELELLAVDQALRALRGLEGFADGYP